MPPLQGFGHSFLMGIKNPNPLSSFCSPILHSPLCRDPQAAPLWCRQCLTKPLISRALSMVASTLDCSGSALGVLGSPFCPPPGEKTRSSLGRGSHCPAPAPLQAQSPCWGYGQSSRKDFYHPRPKCALVKALYLLQHLEFSCAPGITSPKLLSSASGLLCSRSPFRTGGVRLCPPAAGTAQGCGASAASAPQEALTDWHQFLA